MLYANKAKENMKVELLKELNEDKFTEFCVIFDDNKE